jgi:glycosyltransferase involved in cell wall biosynthesis
MPNGRLHDSGSDPTVAVIVPTYNSARFVEQALHSIATQTFTRLCCTVVDDGSTDGTVDVVRTFADTDGRFNLLCRDHAGVSPTRNAGIDAIPDSARYVCFFDSDDVWAPQALTLLVEAVEADPGLVGAHGLADRIDADGSPLDPGTFADNGRRRFLCAGGRAVPSPAGSPTTFDNLAFTCNMFPMGLVLIRRAALDRVGRFDADLPACEDWDLLIRLARHGDFCLINEVMVGYRTYEGSLTSTAVMRDAHRVVRRKTLISPENSPAQWRAARDAWRAVERAHARTHWDVLGRAVGERQWHDSGAAAARVLLASTRFAIGRPSALTLDRGTHLPVTGAPTTTG